MRLGTDGSPGSIAWRWSPWRIVLNTIEGQLVTPMLIGARMLISALGIFVAIAFGAWLWGAAGALIATPKLIVASAFVTRFDAVTSRRRYGARSPRNAVI